MYLAKLLHANPLMALALLICLATILWCILLTRRQRYGLDKILTGVLGLLVVYDALRILKDSGFSAFARFPTMAGWVDLTSSCLYVVAALILKNSSSDRAATKVHLRLVEADEKPLDLGGALAAAPLDLGHPLLDASPLAVFAVNAHGIVTYWNASAENLLGWTRGEMLGNELPFDPDGPLQGKNGRRIDAAVWASPVRSLHGQPNGAVMIAAGEAALQRADLEFRSLALPRAAAHG
jgi:PAS domain-containing protein